ncbi:3-isopropylmalate dehydratase, small subunit [Chloroherpeton thalassium ATCC 35110]|uniref:3-isopropylmalate dehydratase n=1 Tax=Chloroherpeton thalassium (strain ATCC 35110 / GB-78) TaxID=517418 RepID=B3QSN6_CHLT3|nr:3-isopropylmalate dehydratase small subunit [Chloroherpeton thalassium]ACF14083.1 3-isopropylmalate dehydratase, small subunit [Chloroherpeton thalassium ATCC 35110]
MENIIKGKAYVLGNNIDTDQIIPAEHLVYSLTDPEELKNYGRYALSGVPPVQGGLPDGNIPFINGENYESEYSIIIGGSNFGCGSSREHAPFALQVAGVKAIIAESYARIFYRNSVDGGFVVPCEATEKINDKIKTGDEVEINVAEKTLTNLTDGKTYALNPLGDVLSIVEAGGIFEYARKNALLS